jgi:hypothetical protein
MLNSNLTTIGDRTMDILEHKLDSKTQTFIWRNFNGKLSVARDVTFNDGKRLVSVGTYSSHSTAWGKFNNLSDGLVRAACSKSATEFSLKASLELVR